MTTEITDEMLNQLVKEIIATEKEYAHELTGVRNDRRYALRKLINKFVAEQAERNSS